MSDSNNKLRKKTVLLWIALLLGPLAWAVQLQAVYALADETCKENVSLLVLHLVTAGCLVASLTGSGIGLRSWISSGRSIPSDHADESNSRMSLMSVESMLAGMLFAMVIIAQWLAIDFLTPCPA
jgi:hypothetical protein